MKRLLIVDDEHHIVNWLAELFENQADMDLMIFKSYSGRNALEILETTKIDIILLDIKMPDINGLQVSQRILQQWPGCRIIFLTGYNTFDYAYYANKHKNITYLLKIESDEEIIRAVKNAIASIQNENEYLTLSVQAAAKEKISNYLYHRRFLAPLFHGKSPAEAWDNQQAKANNFPLQPDEPVYLLYGKLSALATDYGYESLHDSVMLSIQVMDKVLYHTFNYVMYDYDDTTIVWLLQPCAGFSTKDPQFSVMYLKESFDDMISFYNENSALEVVLLLYPKAIPWSGIYTTFLSLNQFILQETSLQNEQSYGMLYQETSQHSDNEEADNNLINKCDTLLRQMTSCFSQGEYRKFSHLLRQITFASKNVQSMHYLPIVSIYQRISSLLINHINKYQLWERLSMTIGLYPLYFIHNFENWQEAFRYLDRLTTILFDLNDNIQLDKNQRLTTTIKDYIQEHLADDLTLTVLADVVHYNSCYVSRVFKQTHGMNLSDYIKLCRINKAKELLENTDDSVGVIAQKVGFDTPQYFSTIFHTETGLSPGDFRRQH